MFTVLNVLAPTLALLQAPTAAPQSSPPELPHVRYGQLTRFVDFPSKIVPPRNVDIWVPDGYSPQKRYAVLYMQDGQVLYDGSMSLSHQAWDMDLAMGRLLKVGAIQDCIVVGIWNRREFRSAEYFPQKPLKYLPPNVQTSTINDFLKGEPLADRYLRFLVHELKPYVDAHFSTRRDRADTFIGGSSMGGLISMYALCEYPNVFGGAACMSTHWPGSFTADPSIPSAFIKYLDDRLPDARSHKLYFDRGDKTLDAGYPHWQDLADQTMARHGWKPSSWVTLVFPGDDHSEGSWSKRLVYPLCFLLGKRT